MKPVAYLFVASVLTSAFVGLTACDSSSSGGGSSGAGGSGNFLGGGAGTTGGTTGIDEPAGAAGTKAGTGGKAGTSSSTQGGGTDDTFGGGGTDPTGGAGTDPTGGAGTSSGQTCQECASDQCASELTTCQGNKACLAIDTCLGKCASGDSACQQQCLTDNPTGKDDFLAVNNCALDKCADPCGGGSSGNDCQTCVQGSCSSEVTTCQNSADCQALIKCLDDTNCNDQTCYQTCVQASPKGQAPFEAANNCVLNNCQSECQ